MFEEPRVGSELQPANCPQDQGLAYSVAMLLDAEHCLAADEVHYLEVPELALVRMDYQT